jgi:hypothetical protein
LDFNGSTLYDLNTGPGSPPPTHIVTIDATTGTVSDIGPSLNSLDAIAFQPAPSLPGDYINNGTVDAGDYVLWRKYQGTTRVLPNDPTGGTIGASQYTTWRANFGKPSASGTGSTVSAAVPEPIALILLMFVAANRCLLRSRTA